MRFVSALLAVGVLFAQQQQPDLPAAASVIDRFLDASGGKSALAKHKTRYSRGTLEMSAMRLKGTIELYQKAPNKQLSAMNMPGFGLVQEGFDGEVAWSRDPATGLREKKGAELASTRLFAHFHRTLMMRELYPVTEVKGGAAVEGRNTWLIEARPVEGHPEKWYFDKETGLLVRTNIEREGPHGRLQVEADMEDYREVDGIKLPFRMKQRAAGASITIVIEEIRHGVAIDDAKFAKPIE